MAPSVPQRISKFDLILSWRSAARLFIHDFCCFFLLYVSSARWTLVLNSKVLFDSVVIANVSKKGSKEMNRDRVQRPGDFSEWERFVLPQGPTYMTGAPPTPPGSLKPGAHFQRGKLQGIRGGGPAYSVRFGNEKPGFSLAKSPCLPKYSQIWSHFMIFHDFRWFYMFFADFIWFSMFFIWFSSFFNIFNDFQ